MIAWFKLTFIILSDDKEARAGEGGRVTENNGRRSGNLFLRFFPPSA